MKWEYKIYSGGKLFGSYEPDINKLGEEGWELVAVTSNLQFYFKRPIR